MYNDIKDESASNGIFKHKWSLILIWVLNNSPFSLYLYCYCDIYVMSFVGMSAAWISGTEWCLSN